MNEGSPSARGPASGAVLPGDGPDRIDAPQAADRELEIPRFDLATFARENALVLIAAAGAMLLTYGYALTSASLSIDEETPYLGQDLRYWFEFGRPLVALVKLVFADFQPLPFFDTALGLVALYVAGVTSAALVVRAIAPAAVHRAGMLVFLVVFTTLPVNAYFLTFDNQVVPVSIGLACAAAAGWFAWSWAVERSGRGAALAAFGLALVAGGTYQSLVLTFVAGVLLAQLARLVTRGSAESIGTRRAITETARLVAPGVAATIILAIGHRLLVPQGHYIEGFISWGTADPVSLLTHLLGTIGLYFIGRGFEGGWVLIPTVLAAAVLLVLVLRWCWRAGWWYPLAVLVFLGVTPFALSIALGHPLPNRALLALPLVAGGVWLLLALMVGRTRWLFAGLLVVAGFLTIWDAGLTTRLFVTERANYEMDRVLASQLTERLAEAGWTGEPITIATIGRRVRGPVDGLAAHDTFGASFFEWDDGRRAHHVLRLLGYRFRPPSPEQWDTARALAASMPAWPARGSVVLEDGLAIVNLSSSPP